MREECQNCRFYISSLCRRYPPQVVFDSDVKTTIDIFLVVDPKEWCGEWKERKDA